jgi:hypothetical protein
VEGNDSLYAYTIRNTANNKRVTGQWVFSDAMFAGNYIALVSLDTLSFAFDNAKVNDNGVTGLEVLDVVKSFSLDQ